MEDFIARITERINNEGVQTSRSAKISEDGSILIYGCFFKGCALIFTRRDDRWEFQQKLLASDGVGGDNFGVSVSISSDGSTAIVGAHNKSSITGAAYVFTRTESTWTQQAKLVAGDAYTSDRFGVSVSISSDGSTALIGAYSKSSWTGAAYVFTRSGTAWTQQQKLTASDGVGGDNFGIYVSLSSDGNTALVFDRYNKKYVFTPVDGKWVETASIQGPCLHLNSEA